MHQDDIRYFMDQPQPKEMEALCSTHGPFRATNIAMVGVAWSRCPSCEKAHDAARARHQQEINHEEMRRATARHEAKMDATGIPKRFRNRELFGYHAETEAQRAALDFAVDYANNFELALQTGRSVVFVGNTGTGKTHLAVGIALHIHRKGGTVRYATVQQAIHRVQHAWRRDGETESAILKDYAGCDLLVLDEIGVQFGSEFERNLLFGILNDRYNNQRPTILISNLTQEMVGAFLGERVIDRMREDGGRIIPFVWTSHRKEPS